MFLFSRPFQRGVVQVAPGLDQIAHLAAESCAVPPVRVELPKNPPDAARVPAGPRWPGRGVHEGFASGRKFRLRH
jgi:hypothetical protein